jgi:tRNA/rRNA methyltransferase
VSDPETPRPADAGRGVRIVLVRPKIAENVGAAARAMKNFGLEDLVLVAPRTEVNKSAYALASHAGDVLENARIVPDVGAALEGVTWALGTSARGRASEAVREYEVDDALATLPAEGGALVFGPEDHGLANDELDRCQALLRIPTAAYASINLSQAVNVVAQRWFERRRQAPDLPTPDLADPVANPARPAPAPREQVERFYADLVALWHEIGYTDANREAATLRLYRGVFDRTTLSVRELAALRGLVSQASWAARLPPDRLPGRAAGADDEDEHADADA